MAGPIFLLLFLTVATFTLGTSAQIAPEVARALQEEKQALIETSRLSEEEAEREALKLAFPTLVRTTLHPLFAGLVIAAIMAAVMSSADSCLSCLATVIMEDVYRRHLRPAAMDPQLLRVARWATLSTGVAAGACAWLSSNIADILEFVYDFWAPSMVLPFMVGVFAYRVDRVHAVVASMVAGVVTTVVWRFVLYSPAEVGPALFGFAVAAVTFFVALPITCRRPRGGLFRPDDEATATRVAGADRTDEGVP